MIFCDMMHMIHFRAGLYGGEDEMYVLKLPKSYRQRQKPMSFVSLEARRQNWLFRIGKTSHRVGRELGYEHTG